MRKILVTDEINDLASFIVHFLNGIDYEVKVENGEFVLCVDEQELLARFKDEYESEDLEELVADMWYDIDYSESYMEPDYELYEDWLDVLKKLEAMR